MGHVTFPNGKYEYRTGNRPGDRGFIPGTEDMWEHPDVAELPDTHDVYKGKGLIHYGTIKYKGESLYKIGQLNQDVQQLQTIGWVLVHRADAYAYMRKPL